MSASRDKFQNHLIGIAKTRGLTVEKSREILKILTDLGFNEKECHEIISGKKKKHLFLVTNYKILLLTFVLVILLLILICTRSFKKELFEIIGDWVQEIMCKK